MRKKQIDRGEYLSRTVEHAIRGEELPQARLTKADVIAIRAAAERREAMRHEINMTLSNDALAKLHNVHVCTIEKVLSYETWKHVF